MRTIALAAPAVAALVLALAAEGGFFLADWGLASIVLLGLLGVAVLVLPVTLGGRTGWIALGGWTGLALWQGLSSAWADQPSSAVAAMNRTLLYTAALGLALVGVRAVGDLRRLTGVSLAGAAVVAAAGVGARLAPSVVPGDWHGRLSTPVSYWNGMAAVAAFGAVIAVGVGADRSRAAVSRALAGASVPLFALVVLLTESRGGALVLLLGLAALIAAAPGRLETLAVAGATLLAAAPVVLYANAQEALTPQGFDLPRDGEGLRTGLLLLGSMVLAAACAAVLGRLAARGTPAVRRRVGLALAGAALLAMAALLIARPPDGGPVAWADRQFEAFRSFDPRARDEAQSVADRLVVAAGSGRWQNWEVAGAAFEDAPIAGTGAGDYPVWWDRERSIDINVENAHSLYLETLGESGLVGLALLLVPLGAAVAALWLASRRRPGAADGRALVVAAVGAGVVAVHMAGDWDWQLPAVTLPAVALGGGVLAAAARLAAGEGGLPRLARPVAWGVAVACVLAIAAVAGPTASARLVADGNRRAADGDLRGALSAARDAGRLDPASPQAHLLEARVLTDLGRPAEADAAYAAALSWAPRDWEVMADWAAVLLRRGDEPAARLLIARARAANPLERRIDLLAEATGP